MTYYSFFFSYCKQQPITNLDLLWGENKQKIVFKRRNCFPEQPHKYCPTHFDLPLNPPRPKKSLNSSNCIAAAGRCWSRQMKFTIRF